METHSSIVSSSPASRVCKMWNVRAGNLNHGTIHISHETKKNQENLQNQKNSIQFFDKQKLPNWEELVTATYGADRVRRGVWSGSRGWNSFLSLFANRWERRERRELFLYIFCYKTLRFFLPSNSFEFLGYFHTAMMAKHNIFSKAYEHDVLYDGREQPTKSRSLFFASISFSVLFLWKFIVFIFSHSLLYIFSRLFSFSFGSQPLLDSSTHRNFHSHTI